MPLRAIEVRNSWLARRAVVVHDEAALGVDQQVVGDARQGGVAGELHGEVLVARARGQDLDDDQRLGHEQAVGDLGAAHHHVRLEGGVGVDLDLRTRDEHLAGVAALASAAPSAWSIRRLMRACTTVSAAMACAGAGPRTGTGSPSMSSQRSPSGRRLAQSRKAATVIRSNGGMAGHRRPRIGSAASSPDERRRSTGVAVTAGCAAVRAVARHEWVKRGLRFSKKRAPPRLQSSAAKASAESASERSIAASSLIANDRSIARLQSCSALFGRWASSAAIARRL